ncbi:Zinc finger, C3HC4 type (RING finger) protein [Ceratobasidium sp. AG-Ba]|nr:Zinc finger, C3HC4 type (RING finger) protein [Ceratobasidium sp. AG-Ba]
MLKVIASSTCDVCFVEYEYDNPPHCIPCGHVSCKSCLESMIAANANTADPNSARCAFCRTTFEQSGVRRLHVDLGAVPTEVASSDGSETINGDEDGDEDENRALAREAEKRGISIANAIFQKNEDKIRKTASEGQKWVAAQKRTKPGAGFPVLTALAQLAIGNMENFHACQLLEKKLLDSRENEARLIQKIQAFEEVTSREQQKIRVLEQESENLRQSLSSTERSLRTTTSSLADATASLAESDTALAAAKIELASRQDVRAERDALKEELQKTKEDSKRMKKELTGVKAELKNLKLGGVETEATGTGAGAGVGVGKQEEPIPEKLQRRRSRKMSHSASKAAAANAAAAVAATVAATVDDSEAFATGSGTGSATKKGHGVKKSRKKVDPEQTEDEAKDQGDHDHDKSGEHPRSKKERGRDRHREKKDKDDDQPTESGPTTDQPRLQPDGSEFKEKVHKSGKKKKRHASQERVATSPERAGTAPPGTEIKTQETIDALADSVSSKSPDPPAPGASTSKNASSPPPTTNPRRGLVETLSRPGPLSKDGPAMRVLRKAMGRKAASPNASHDLGSSSTVINMTPAPAAAPSPVGSTSSAPAGATSPTVEHDLDPSQVPRTVAYASYPLPPVENIAGFGVPTLGHHYSAQRFPESNRSRRAGTPENDMRAPNPLPRPPRASEEEPEPSYDRERERDFAWGYDSAWDRSGRGTGKGRERDRDRTYRRRHLPNEWQDEPPVQVRRYVAADEVPGLSASSRHGMFDFGDSPPAYPMYEHGILDGTMPRKSSYANLRSMK